MFIEKNGKIYIERNIYMLSGEVCLIEIMKTIFMN